MKQMRKLQLPQLYTVGDFIDAKDNQGDWRVGYIIQKNQVMKTYKIRFDGWASKYDEIFKYGNNNNRLKQFRRYVYGYTGQKQNPGIRNSWRFIFQQHQDKIMRLHNMITKKYEPQNEHQYNQYIRGYNYFYTDYLMTLTFQKQLEIQKVIEFFKLNIHFLCLYLKQIAKQFKRFIENITIPQQNININIINNNNHNQIQIAKDNSYYEIFDSMYIISGSYQRLAQFFKENQTMLRREFQGDIMRDIKIAYQIKMIDYFYKLGGFEALDSIVKQCLQRKRLIPFRFLYSLVHLYYGVCTHLQLKSKLSIIQQLRKVTSGCVAQLSQKQLKDFNYQQTLELISEIYRFGYKTSIQQNILQWSQYQQMQIYYKMIKCQYFEKKLKGITLLHQFVEKNSDRMFRASSNNYNNIKNSTLTTNISLNSTKISSWIQQKKLFQILLLNDNPQIIKKTNDFIKYLYIKDNQNMKQYILLVWRYREGKHQTVMKQIYSFISEIPCYDKNQQFTLKFYKSQLSRVKQQDWDLDYIKMVKDYTVNALYLYAQKNIQQTYGFNIIYQYLIRNQNDLNVQTYLLQIFNKLQNHQFKNQICENLLNNIQQIRHQALSIVILLKIFKEKLVNIKYINNIKRTGNMDNNTKMIVNKNNSKNISSGQIDLLQLIIRNIILHKDTQNQSNMGDKFQLLTQVLKQLQQSLQLQLFELLFYQLIDSKCRKYLFGFLYKIKDNGRVMILSHLNNQIRNYLIGQLWTNIYFKKYQNLFNQDQAVFFVELVKSINHTNKRIQRAGLVFSVINQQLIGIDKMFIAYKQSKDQQACDILAKGIAEIYMSGSELLQNQSYSFLGRFIMKVFDNLVDYMNRGDIQLIKKWIKLIQQVILRDQQIYNINQVVRKFIVKDIIVKNCSSSNLQEKVIKCNIEQSVYSFKKIIADKFGLGLHKFDIIVENNWKISYEQYFLSLGQIGIPLKIIIKKRQQQNSRVKRQLNGQLQLLFELLGRPEIQQKVWSIVSKLPISDDLRGKLVNSTNLLQFLSNQSFYKQLYTFRVALSFNKNWWLNISNTQLIQFFIMKLSLCGKLKSQIEREYYMVCNKIIEQIIMFSNGQQANNNQINDIVLYKKIIRTTLKKVTNLLQETKHLLILNLDTVTKSIQSFFYFCQKYNQLLIKKGIISTQTSGFMVILQDKQVQIGDFLKSLLISYGHQKIRKQFSIRLSRLALTNKQTHFQKLAQLIFNDLLDYSVQFSSKNNLREYNTFSVYILQSISGLLVENWMVKNGQEIFNKLFTLIKNEKNQISSQTISMSLYCYLSLLRFVISHLSHSNLQDLFSYIYNECLFKGKQSKCKSKQSRNGLFNILLKLIKNYNQYQQKTIIKFSQLHQNALWRTRKLEDWMIIHTQRLKSTMGYVGLKNLGCICYMNSFFQQIFMIPEFRLALLLAQDSQTLIIKNQNVLYQVQRMFINLFYSDKKSYNPKSFCLAFKDYEGNPTNVNQQMDIDQFSGILFDRLQNSMKGTKYQSLIKDTFGGVFSNQIICKGCPHFSQSEESFLSLSLTVKDKKSIYQSLQTMIKGDTLDGDNAYYCQRCDKKVSAVKRVCLKSLPDNLIVTLKRFQFDFMTMNKLKINEYCQFPNQLNLQQYSYQYLRKSQNPLFFQAQQIKSKKYYQYRLKGVVIHLGYADSGHYYSLIQQRNGQQKWMQFNDSIVRKFNFQNLNQQAFGGQTGGVESKQKIKNAYMLIYERVQKLNIIKLKLKQNLQFTQNQNIIKNNQNYKQIFDILNQQNLQYKVQSILFSAQYQRFINVLIDQAKINKSLQLQKFIILSYLTVITRSKGEVSPFETLLKIYNSFIIKNNVLCSWILQQLCDLRIYQQFFRNNPIKQVRKTLAFFVLQLFKYVQDQSLKQRFINMVIKKITKENQNTTQMIMIMYYLVEDMKYLQYLVKNNIIGRMIENIIRKQPRLFVDKGNIMSQKSQQQKRKQNYLGYQQLIQRTAFELKKAKYDNQHGYVWGLIYKILFKINGKGLSKVLRQEQYKQIYLSKEKIYKLLQQVKGKVDIDMLTDYLVYLSYNNEDFTMELFLLCQRGIKEFQSKRYRQFFILFGKLISFDDHLIDKRLTGIHFMLRSLKQNQKYSMDCTIIQLWLAKIINQPANIPLRSYLKKQRQILDYLKNLAMKKIPSDQLSKKNIAFNQSSVNKYHGIPFPTSRKGYSKVLKQLQQFYQKMAGGQKYYQKLSLFQSGDHIVGSIQKITKDVKIAYFDLKDKLQFEQYNVINVFLHKICIIKKNVNNISNKSIWVWEDEERLSLNLKAIKKQNKYDLDSSKTTEMEDEDQFDQ